MYPGVKAALLMLFLVATTACFAAQMPAPIVNGWQQPAGKHSYYIVQKGDTLYSVAWAFGMDYRELARLNHLKPPYDLYTGQRLSMGAPLPKSADHVIPAPSMKKVTQKTPKRTYKQLPAPGKIPLPAKAKAEKKPVDLSPPTILGPVHQWLWPTRGKVIQGFSLAAGGCKGIDVAGKTGQPVVAAASGIVVYSGAGLRGYGNLIIIKHNADYLSAYAFNKSLLVKEGAAVKAGQKIALMGSNNAGKVMLHFEIRRDGKPVNPMQFLKPE